MFRKTIITALLAAAGLAAVTPSVAMPNPNPLCEITKTCHPR